MRIYGFSLIYISPYMSLDSQRISLYLPILCNVHLNLWVNLGTTFFSVALAKILCRKRKNCCIDNFQCIFFFFFFFVAIRHIYWASILNLLNSNQIPQDSNWCVVPISDLNKSKRHNVT